MSGRPHLIMFCYGVFIIGTLLSMIASGIWFGESQIGIINHLAGFSIIKVQTMGEWAIPKNIYTFFGALITMVGWKYPFLDNPWGEIFKVVFLYPITIGVIVTIVEAAATVIQGIAGTIRSLLPGA